MLFQQILHALQYNILNYNTHILIQSVTSATVCSFKHKMVLLKKLLGMFSHQIDVMD